uniref:Sodium/hydrogen exchanger n=1 Tax=Ditylenchus dipsaci TaxID=166011 RepID=A0A915CY74_9BILA
MAILFCAITMSQYTHFNISPITQITMRQTFRTISFVAETCTFAYLGLALFTIKLVFHPVFLVWGIILLFASRAASIFPLSYLVNKCRRVQISLKNQIIMWFSGMRGAVAFALALHMCQNVMSEETKGVILTSTLFIVLFTIVFMGGTALPMIKVLSELFPEEPSSKVHKKRKSRRSRRKTLASRRKNSPVILSKTQEMVLFDNSEHFTECEESDGSRRRTMPERKNIFTALNESVVRPFFVRKFTQQEKQENKQKLRHIAFEAMKSNNPNAGNESSSEAEEVFFQSANNSVSESHSTPLLPV